LHYLNDVGLLCTLGNSKEDVVASLLTRERAVPAQEELFSVEWGRRVGRIRAELTPLPAPLSRFDCRNNRLARAAIDQIRPAIDQFSQRFGANRMGVVMGTSTSGIADSEHAVREVMKGAGYPKGYHAIRGVLGGLGEFVAAYLETSGPTSTVSTACSSSGNAILSARRLLELDLCDAVIVGGVDSLCEMTVRGFGSLEALASDYCKPLTAARDGINIGEGAAIFLMSKEEGGVRLLGGAGSSDAYHVSAPHPEGEGAFQAMRDALLDGDLTPSDIDYLNLHGTGTTQNDLMECKAVDRIVGRNTPCSSTKSMTGHTLGAGSALELSFCWLLLTTGVSWRLPPSLYLDERDPHLAPVQLTGKDDYEGRRPRVCMSNSFAFGGSNVSLLIGVSDE
jgi:3-oxoacyl-[acyl-carrier-protein] synthase-1